MKNRGGRSLISCMSLWFLVPKPHRHFEEPFTPYSNQYAMIMRSDASCSHSHVCFKRTDFCICWPCWLRILLLILAKPYSSFQHANMSGVFQEKPVPMYDRICHKSAWIHTERTWLKTLKANECLLRQRAKEKRERYVPDNKDMGNWCWQQCEKRLDVLSLFQVTLCLVIVLHYVDFNFSIL